MKRIVVICFSLLCLSFAVMAEPVKRIVLQAGEAKDIEISQIPGIGIVSYLDGDSLMILDDPELPIVHIKAIDGARQIVATDSAVYCAVGHYICRLLEECDTLVDVAVIDNNQFRLYPASGDSFFVVSSDEEWASCKLFDPTNGVYADILDIDMPIYKVLANSNHVFAWLDDNVVAIGAEGAIATLIKDSTLRDIEFTVRGLLAANDEGLWLIESPDSIKHLSNRTFKRLWYMPDILYLQTDDDSVIAIDDFTEALK